jgi:hypothetical protein
VGDNQDNKFNPIEHEPADLPEAGEKLSTPAHKGLIRAILVFLACAVIALLVWELVSTWSTGPSFSASEINGYYNVHYEWLYKGSKWEYDTQISKETYLYFKERKRTASYKEYVLNTRDDEAMNHIASHFREQAQQKGWGESETLSFVLAFVQSMPYTSDKATTGYDEYPRYPIETLVDGGGDCEDTAILFTSIVREMGYGAALLKLEEDEHMAAGILISQEVVDQWPQQHHDYPLAYYTARDGKIYAYCETTGEGWKLGQKPDDLISQTAQIIDVS